MPAPDSLRPPTETLTNGLQVTLRHAPGLKRSAAVLRVEAGSHDAPEAWPGLAHFLEHLFFLGTARFPAGQDLMAYVRDHGGQVNARTSERITEFFLELPPSALPGGLERLADMLAHPRLDEADQMREREVLHAEFIAWSQDATAQRQVALYEGLSEEHPLRGFHAGNRDSLAVPEPGFQLALHDFFQRFYHSGQMSLSLAGPQGTDALAALAVQFGNSIPSSETQVRQAPPKLMTSTETGYQLARQGSLDALFAFENLPAASPQTFDFLCHWLNTHKPGGLLATLRQRGLADSLKAMSLYEFSGQALLHIELKLDSDRAPTDSQPLLRDWLGFFAAQDDWASMRQEFAAFRQRQQETATALQLARWDSEGRHGPLSENHLMRLREVLKQLHAVDHPVEPWRLPSPNPFLQATREPPRAGLIRGQTSAHRGLRTFAQDRSRGRRERSPLQFSQALPDTSPEGAVYLRWQFAAPASPDLQSRLDRHSADLREDARQAGVDVVFESDAEQCLLKLIGLQAPMPSVFEHLMEKLRQPLPPVLADSEAPLIPIRQLLRELPIFFQQNPRHASPSLRGSDQSVWTNAQWDGLAVGLTAATQAALAPVLARTPGVAREEPELTVAPVPVRTWHTHKTLGDDHALLMFCPTPTEDLSDEAGWRLLAHLCQTPYYQRLRVELQLGYAVFSGLKQIHGRTGLLLGAQSPGASAAQLSEHMTQFLETLPKLVEQIDDSILASQQQALASQTNSAEMPIAQAAELLWQGKLAGRPSGYLQRLPDAITSMTREQLIDSAYRLVQAQGGRFCLSNAPCPGMPWQAAAR